jgi:thiol-disulfide isomerase/thioredoxin
MNLRNELITTSLALLVAAGASTTTAAPTLKVGDPAPKLQTGAWMQGDPVKEFSPGNAYLVEFWATWCGPCRVSIPHLNQLHNQFKDKGLIVIGQDCWEQDESLVAPFIKTMGENMTYRVALDDKNGSAKGKMAESWMAAADRNGIPSAFLVDTKGRIAWIGHPMELTEQLIEDVLSGKFDLATAAAKSLHEQTANDLIKQSFALARDGKLAEAEEPLNRLLAGGNDATAQTVQILTFRANSRAQSGRFPEAAADLARAIEIDPSDHWNWFVLAPLLIQSGKIADYQARCKAMLHRFGNTTNSSSAEDAAMIAERTAKSCLLLPDAVGPDDLTIACNLTGDAVTMAKGSILMYWFQMSKGLAEYRQGHFTDAIEWVRRSQADLAQKPTGDRNMCEADTYFVLAMAQHQLRQSAEADAALARGREIVQTKLPKLDGGDLGSAWHDVLMANILMREAKETIEGLPATAQK